MQSPWVQAVVVAFVLVLLAAVAVLLRGGGEAE